MGETAGLRVMVHSPYWTPNPQEDDFLLIQPNTETNVAFDLVNFNNNQLLIGNFFYYFFLFQTESHRLEYPYTSQCYNSWDQTPIEIQGDSFYVPPVVLAPVLTVDTANTIAKPEIYTYTFSVR
jgi:hypothetical protein